MQETYIAGMGYYRSDDDLFTVQMLRTRPALLAEVLDRCVEERGDSTRYRKLRKFELAAMLADFATGDRRNQESMARDPRFNRTSA